MRSLTYLKEVQQFIGVVNYYRGLQARHLHTLAPSTKIPSNKVKFKYTKIEKDAFGEIKRIVAHDNLLTYPDFNEEFKIHTDDGNFQLVAVISQKFKLIALYGRIIIGSQRRYTVKERGVLSIIETLK